MKQVQKTIGRWVQRFAGKGRSETTVRPASRLTALDAKALRQITGGTGESTQSPTKGW